VTEPAAVPFETGQIVVLGAGPEQSRRWYRTTVQRVDARVIWVDGAPEDQPLVEIQPGESVTCHTWRNMDALYQVQARVAFARLAPEPLVGLTILGAERIQQREYVRVPLSAVATGTYLGSTATSAQTQPLHLEVHDLSAGGLRGRSDLPLSPGDELTLDLPLPPADGSRDDLARPRHLRSENRLDLPVRLHGRVVELLDLPEPLNLRARVVRLIETPRSQDLSPEIGIVFVDLTRETRERIIRFALEVQRDRRRRGMM
jgi:hypothetical protein